MHGHLWGKRRSLVQERYLLLCNCMSSLLFWKASYYVRHWQVSLLLQSVLQAESIMQRILQIMQKLPSLEGLVRLHVKKDYLPKFHVRMCVSLVESNFEEIWSKNSRPLVRYFWNLALNVWYRSLSLSPETSSPTETKASYQHAYDLGTRVSSIFLVCHVREESFCWYLFSMWSIRRILPFFTKGSTQPICSTMFFIYHNPQRVYLHYSSKVLL